MEIKETVIELNKLKLNSLIDMTYNDQNIFFLEKNQIIIFTLDFRKKEILEIENANVLGTKLYSDDIFIYVGFIDGTVEVREIKSPFKFVLITDKADAGGPGDSTVIDMFSTHSLLFVSTSQNGLLIYLKPSITFHKWLMISAYTNLVDFTINNNKVFVMTKEKTIHLLDLEEQKVFDLDNFGYSFTHLTSNLEFLCLYSPNFIRIYDIQNYKLIWSLRVKDNIVESCLLFNNALLVSYKSNLIQLYDLDNYNLTEEKKLDFELNLKWFRRNYLSKNYITSTNHKIEVIYFYEKYFHQIKLKFI